MRLIDIVPEGAIAAPIKALEREAIIPELVDLVIASGGADAASRDDLIARVLDRERILSTGFGRGVAVPHAKHASIRQIVAAVGVSHRGIDFQSPDKQPVYIVFLLLSPEGRPEDHLKAMEAIFKQLSRDTFRRLLRQAGSAFEVRQILKEVDAQGV